MKLPEIKPPSENVKAYAEWTAIWAAGFGFVIGLAGVVTLMIAIPFWVSGKQSPIPVVASEGPDAPKHDRIRDAIAQRKAHRKGEFTDKDFESMNRRERKRTIPHLHFDIGPDGKLNVEREDILVPERQDEF